MEEIFFFQFETGSLASQVDLEFAMCWKMDMILSPSPKFWVIRIHDKGHFLKSICVCLMYIHGGRDLCICVCERERKRERETQHARGGQRSTSSV